MPQNQIFDYSLELVFPKHCLICESYDTWLCSDCASAIQLKSNQTCPRCNQPSILGVTHDRCRIKSSLDGLISLTYYEQVKPLLHAYKYSLVRALGPYLASTATEKIERLKLDAFFQDKIFTAAPLHPARLRYRGFNQSAELAKLLAKRMNTTYDELLVKTKDTKPQKDLKMEGRKTNLQGAFAVAEAKDIGNKKVVIFDDITTTSSTLAECAKILKSAGATQVWGLALAHE